ncbi:MAG: glutamine synthetase, partial [Lachnospiraceae bacterium]|nr:glutamine synthetase [Lachnospiraceae bacterium]
LAAGMDGIYNKMQAQEELTEDLSRLSEEERSDRERVALPENLGEALAAMKNDRLICDTLGTDFYVKYMNAKRKEWKGYLEQVSEWELERYLYQI